MPAKKKIIPRKHPVIKRQPSFFQFDVYMDNKEAVVAHKIAEDGMDYHEKMLNHWRELEAEAHFAVSRLPKSDAE